MVHKAHFHARTSCSPQIVDCRPKLNADVNRARGKGYERPQDYPNTQIAFMGIENIHAMRASLKVRRTRLR